MKFLILFTLLTLFMTVRTLELKLSLLQTLSIMDTLKECQDAVIQTNSARKILKTMDVVQIFNSPKYEVQRFGVCVLDKLNLVKNGKIEKGLSGFLKGIIGPKNTKAALKRCGEIERYDVFSFNAELFNCINEFAKTLHRKE